MPAFFDIKKIDEAGLKFVSHEELFLGYEHVLPVFASTSIETMLWRIEGLTEQFVYFNDDFFVLGSLEERDLFNPKPILRGEWKDLTDPAASWLWRRRNAATMLGISPEAVFLEFHSPAPLSKSICEELFDRYRGEFISNMAYRFRSERAFHLVTLHNNYLLAQGLAEVDIASRNVTLDRCPVNASEDEALKLLSKLRRPKALFGCVNNLGSFLRVAPSAYSLLDEVFGTPLAFERLNRTAASQEEEHTMVLLSMLQAGKTTEAFRLLLKSIMQESARNEDEDILAQAKVLRKEGRWSDAIPCFAKLLTTTLSQWHSYCLAECLRKNNQTVEALVAYSYAGQLDPSHYWTVLFIGKIQAQLGWYGEAVASLERATRIKADHAWAWYFLGTAYASLMCWPKAIRAMDKALSIDTSLGPAKRALVEYRLAMGRRHQGET
jgi:tetratricopeptide (TPR) repeat protein